MGKISFVNAFKRSISLLFFRPCAVDPQETKHSRFPLGSTRSSLNHHDEKQDSLPVISISPFFYGETLFVSEYGHGRFPKLDPNQPPAIGSAKYRFLTEQSCFEPGCYLVSNGNPVFETVLLSYKWIRVLHLICLIPEGDFDRIMEERTSGDLSSPW